MEDLWIGVYMSVLSRGMVRMDTATRFGAIGDGYKDGSRQKMIIWTMIAMIAKAIATDDGDGWWMMMGAQR